LLTANFETIANTATANFQQTIDIEADVSIKYPTYPSAKRKEKMERKILITLDG
jgi:hypothetical protein